MRMEYKRQADCNCEIYTLRHGAGEILNLGTCSSAANKVQFIYLVQHIPARERMPFILGSAPDGSSARASIVHARRFRSRLEYYGAHFEIIHIHSVSHAIHWCCGHLEPTPHGYSESKVIGWVCTCHAIHGDVHSCH